MLFVVVYIDRSVKNQVSIMKEEPQSVRERLIRTTGQLLRSHGYYGTGLDEILKDSDAPKGSLYHYFPGGKRQLASEAVRYMAGRMAKRMVDDLSLTADPIEGLRLFLAGRAKDLEASGFKSGCPIATVTLETASEHSDLCGVCSQSFDGLKQILHEHLSRAGFGQERANSLATLFLASWEGALILSRAHRNTKPLDIVAKEICAMIGGILGKGQNV